MSHDDLSPIKPHTPSSSEGYGILLSVNCPSARHDRVTSQRMNKADLEGVS